MTVELLDQTADDVEEVLIAWLMPLGRAGIRRSGSDPLPFRLVTRITGADDPWLGCDDPVVSVHTLASVTDPAAAADEAEKTHRRLMYLARHLPDVTLTDGRIANLDYLSVADKPFWLDYGDPQILRKVGRYQLGLAYVAAP